VACFGHPDILTRATRKLGNLQTSEIQDLGVMATKVPVFSDFLSVVT
jgi:hypothetical protein